MQGTHFSSLADRLTHVAVPRRTLGAVLVHGFTANQRGVEPLAQIAQDIGMVTDAPLLRGHGGRYQDLRGTTWDHWMEDVTNARHRLSPHVDGIVLVGFSMGGLLALASAAQQPTGIVALIALAPALRIAHPLAPLAWLARPWLPFVPMGKAVAYSDAIRAETDDSYSRLALDAFSSFFAATRRVEQLLPKITAPLLLMHARRDRVIKPMSSRIVFERVRSTVKELVWLDHSGHALLDDCEALTVKARVQRFLMAQERT